MNIQKFCSPIIRQHHVTKRLFSTVRINVCTGEWISFPGKERESRPQQVPPPKRIVTAETLVDDKCPFCVGNEHSLPESLLSLYSSDFTNTSKVSFKLTVVPNRFPLVSPTLKIDSNYPSIKSVAENIYKNEIIPTPCKESHLKTDEFELNFNTSGFHEVVIGHIYHNLSVLNMSAAYWQMLLRSYRDRTAVIHTISSSIKSILCYKNHGILGGGSITHPHSQIVALPFIPAKQLELLRYALKFYEDNNECVYCNYISKEITKNERIIEKTEHFVALIPYAARLPFLIQIFPLFHSSQFALTEDFMLKKLSRMIRRVTLRLYSVLKGDYDYNVILVNAPFDRNCESSVEKYFHWHIEIIPRLDSYPVAGFEFTSGILCNSMLPENNADSLKEVNLLELKIDEVDYLEISEEEVCEHRCEHSRDIRHIHP